MRRLILLLALLAILTPLLLAAPQMRLLEFFSWVRCPNCPNPQSGLELVFDELPDTVIPFVNYRYTEGHIDRGLIYAFNEGEPSVPIPAQHSTPRLHIDGVVRSTGSGNAEARKAAIINHLNADPDPQSPFLMEPTLSINENGKLVMSVTVTVEEDFTDDGFNRIYFALTTDPGPAAEYNLKRFGLQEPLAYQSFDLATQGDSQTYTHEFKTDPTLPLDKMRAISFIQRVKQVGTVGFDVLGTGGAPIGTSLNPNGGSFKDYPYYYPLDEFPAYDGNAPIYQATVATFTLTDTDAIAAIGTDVQTGPPTLVVQFFDCSISKTDITGWLWDFGDGNTSTEQNPVHHYTTPGTYTVQLRINTNETTYECTYEDHITVTNTANIAGEVRGIWTAAGSPYLVTGDVIVPNYARLVIEEGAEIRFAPNTELRVQGELIIEGSADNEVLLTGVGDDTWNGIFLPNLWDVGNDDLTDETKTATIKYAIFQNVAKSAINAACITNGNMITRNVIIENCLFIDNVGDTDPVVDLTHSTGTVISHNYFTGNQSTPLRLYRPDRQSSSVVEIHNNVIANNTGLTAAGIYIDGINENRIVNITNNTIFNNEAVHSEPDPDPSPIRSAEYGTIVVAAGTVNIMNTIINGADENSSFPIINTGTGIINVNYSNIVRPSEETGAGEIDYGVGNLNTDPLFEGATGEIGFDGTVEITGWYLDDMSPCIDAGNPDPLYNDIEGLPGIALYPSKGTIRNDMGAFGGGGGVPINENDTTVKPAGTALRGNYPNPFNPTTSIAFSVETAYMLSVQIDIFNIKGQKVRSLVNGDFGAGVHSVVWNGTDDSGRNVGSGVYFYRMKTDNFAETRRMLLLK